MIFLAAAALLFALSAAGLILLRQAITPRVFPYMKSYAIEVEKGKLVEAEYLDWDKHEISLDSPFGYRLSGTYFPLPGAQKTAIIVHGFTYTRMGSVKYLPLFRRRGFNVLIYDQRYHGLSGGPNTTFGFYEKHDLKAMVDWALAQLGPGGRVGTHGESLGAATCLLHAASDPRPAFVIADCGYADLTEQLALRLRLDYHLPAFPLLPAASLLCRMKAGFHFRQVSPLREAAGLTMPVLFIHGLDDDYIPPEHSQRLYQASPPGLGSLYLAPNAGHAEALWNNRVEYDRRVGEFLEQAGI